MGYSKTSEQPQGSARPICHSHAMTRTGSEPATICIAALELAALRTAPWETTHTNLNHEKANRYLIGFYPSLSSLLVHNLHKMF